MTAGHQAADGDLLLEHMPVVGYRCRTAGGWTCDYIGDGVAAFGFMPSRWLGDPGMWLRQVHRDDRDRVARERLKAARDGTLSTEYRLRTPDGGERWVHDRASVHENADGQVIAHGVLLDITDERQAGYVIEDSFASATILADELQYHQSVDEAMLRLFSHDVRSPLAAAGGLVATLRNRHDDIDPDERLELLERVASAIHRATRLVEELEEHWGDHRVSADPGAAEIIDLCEVLASVVEEVGADDQQVEVVCQDMTVMAIRPLLRRALVGLVRNALIHTGPDAHVVVATVRRDDGVVLVVEDDGPGIPDDAKSAVFEPFVRLADDATAGMGLGLTLVRQVAALHGGETWVQDGGSGGAAFCLFLPGSAHSAA